MRAVLKTRDEEVKKIRFQIVFGAGLVMDGEPMGGELVFYRSLRPLHANKSNHYLAAPGSDEEYARVVVRQKNGHPVSDVVTLEASCLREVQEASGEDEVPKAVYSCVHVQREHEQFMFYGYRVPECLSERTTYSALAVVNVWPSERSCTIEAAEAIKHPALGE